MECAVGHGCSCTGRSRLLKTLDFKRKPNDQLVHAKPISLPDDRL
jgi:hypothetical protein